MTEHEPFQLTAELIDEAVTDLCTVHDWLRWAVSQFNAADLYFGHGTDNPWDDAGVLLAYTLHLTHLAEPALLQTRLTGTEKRQFAALVQQRIEQRIPSAYLTSQAYFVGLPFYVDARVLVPRSPIGELIVQQFETAAFSRWLRFPAPARAGGRGGRRVGPLVGDLQHGQRRHARRHGGCTAPRQPGQTRRWQGAAREAQR